MTAPLCLDTSAYSHFRRAHAPVIEALEEARRVIVPAVVLGELRAGFLAGSRLDENEKRLRRFLAEPVVEVRDVDDAAASAYADIMHDLRAAGTPVVACGADRGSALTPLTTWPKNSPTERAMDFLGGEAMWPCSSSRQPPEMFTMREIVSGGVKGLATGAEVPRRHRRQRPRRQRRQRPVF